MAEITYEDIKRVFSKDDLSKYDLLCIEFVKLTDNKNNIQLWDLVQLPSRLRTILDEIHTLRERYDLLKGESFFKVWRFNPKDNQYEEIKW